MNLMGKISIVMNIKRNILLETVYVHNSSDVKWYEIDDEDDLRYAEEKVVVGL